MLFVLNSLAVGGSETKIIKVANALAKTGVKVEIAYLNPPETGLEKVDSAVPVTNLRRRGKYSIRSLRKLRKLLNREEQVVVAVNLYPLLYVIPAVMFASSKRIRAVGLVNTTAFTGSGRYFAYMYSLFLRRCDRIVFGSMLQQQLWVEKYHLPNERTQVIYNGVDCSHYSPAGKLGDGGLLREELGIPGDAMVFGSVGRLAPEKSFDLLIVALARLVAAGCDAYAVLVGQGNELWNLKNLAEAEGVSHRIKFLGLLNDVRPAIEIMDVFVLPSRTETFSNATLEAMAMARPVVLSETGGAAEMIEQGRSGISFPIGDIDSLTNILIQLNDSRELRQSLGLAGRERVAKLFTFPNMVNEYERLLRS